MQVSDIPTTAGLPREVKTVLWTFSTVIVLIVSVTLIFGLRMRNRARRYLHYQVRWNSVSEAISVNGLPTPLCRVNVEKTTCFTASHHHVAVNGLPCMSRH